LEDLDVDGSIVRLDPREIWWEIVAWMDLTQDRGQWWAAVNTVMNLQVP
jgi:hypothetical protein